MFEKEVNENTYIFRFHFICLGDRKMENHKLPGVLIAALIICGSLGVLPGKMTVDIVSADSQPPQPPYEGINLTYVRQITENLSDVIRKAYNWSNPMELKKGRSFGSIGERYAADEIIEEEMKDIFGPTNVSMQPILATAKHPHSIQQSIFNPLDSKSMVPESVIFILHRSGHR